MAAERPTLPQRLRALAGEPWPFPVPDPDFGMTGNVMREAAQRIEELEARLAGVDSGTHTTNTHQPALGVMGTPAADYLAKVEADPKRAAALQRARERAAGVAGTPAPSGEQEHSTVIAEPPPELEELLERADRLASALRGSRVNYAVEQQAAEAIWQLCEALRASGVATVEAPSKKAE